MDYIFAQPAFRGDLEPDPQAAVLPGADGYRAREAGDGITYRFPAGFLAQYAWLNADFLLQGDELVVFVLLLQEGEGGAQFSFSFGLLNQCQARMRAPFNAVDQNRWRFEREGAWLKPTCWGERVDLAKVDRLSLLVYRKGGKDARFCMTPLTAGLEETQPLAHPLLPEGALIDRLGQNRLRQWRGKSASAEEVTAKLKAQAETAGGQTWPVHFSRWGGWAERNLGGSGFFRTAKDGGRWWLVDPDGHPFWSAGLDCVTPDTGANMHGLADAMEWLPEETGEFAAVYEGKRSETINFLKANLIRAFGARDWYARWAEITLAEMRRMGFNSVANWSDWRMAREAGMPYTRPLESTFERLPAIYRDFPDVFHPDFGRVCDEFAAQLSETRDDPAFIGYFLMNEPTWGFAQLTPAEGLVFNPQTSASRRALIDWLRQRYGTDMGVDAAWGEGAVLERLAAGAWRSPLVDRARADLADFSSLLVERFFGGLSAACRKVDARHLNLGVRYYTVPPAWALEGMRHFDVFSMNCYKQRVLAAEMEQIHAMLDMPILIGEWHFGALDAGLPASGIGHVRDQAGRGQAYRIYLEDAAAKPWCVGVHYFILYDQSALGRFDGENYNIGFLDVCNRPYEALCAAARTSHERMYAVASGIVSPYADEPEYLPMLFL